MNPGARPEKRMVPATPPNSTLGVFVVGARLLRDAAAPEEGGFETTPKPTQ